MKFHYTDLEECHTATGVVIIIDVLRAFSTAAYAFSRGAKQILLVSTVEEALSLKAHVPNAKAMPIRREDGKLTMRCIKP
jgi:2-phosphosulfolactate phosphatase